MEADIRRLKIDRGAEPKGASGWAARWILAGVALFVLLGAAALVQRYLNAAPEVMVVRVQAQQPAGAGGASVVLNATGYIVAAHKIQVASKVIGKVAWIGVEKGDRVKAGQVIVRLEDDEYRAQVQQARGQLAALEARLAELERGSRPEEIDAARAQVEQARAELENARVQLERIRQLAAEKVMSKSALDDAQARYDTAAARLEAAQKNYEIVRQGPRREQIESMRGQVEAARGALAFAETQLANTLIRAPVDGTILERAVEKGEFVTTSFAGERGAKGYVVTLADLNDLRVELDISQNDFAKLKPRQRGIITADAWPGVEWQGELDEIAPEANRQKAAVQVKVRVLNPDERLRPEMNAAVAFLSDQPAPAAAPGRPVVYIPPAAVRNDRVYIVLRDRLVERAIRTSGSTPLGLRVEEGLNGGEDIVLNPGPDLRDGMKVKAKRQ
ncbi:MAG: efflux RND transporter periplasmic adaptor subunit [Bryobacteraceae bacterium]|nr:efflux RND transporter periplasmic adaptor subunit [Bryobacteraceae bacterium]MCX7605116.1 efflux RND transporter periplasmic adaptor subunit [Bryobacteraceae bacterium]